MLELPTSRAMLATARLLVTALFVFLGHLFLLTSHSFRAAAPTVFGTPFLPAGSPRSSATLNSLEHLEIHLFKQLTAHSGASDSLIE